MVKSIVDFGDEKKVGEDRGLDAKAGTNDYKCIRNVGKWLQMINVVHRGPDQSPAPAANGWTAGDPSRWVSLLSTILANTKNNKSWQIQKQQISTMFRCPLKYTLLIKNEQIAVRRSVFGLILVISEHGLQDWNVRFILHCVWHC